ncbi:glycosyltransferase family 2 protein [Sphingobacterium arenae]|uniref:Glycosyltransferase n=1 Tax=Sphingobacterium arenae TaxID=1280598 RepID=A0ABR7Y0W1_9SPHI|nr:glycosyltransferase [Sphingobacterium arenae]MBD1424938.1 glycosyltransferase [Sphingobacterium arenae]
MPDKKKIQITVFMAAYNAADYIAASIESVLEQTYTNFELLIVDDGSTDNTVEIIRSFEDPRIRFIQNDGNKGQPYTRNLALKEANGEFLAVLDSDDIAFPNRLEIQLQHFLNRPQLAVLGGKAHIIDKHGMRTGQEVIPICGSKKLHAALLFYNSFVHPTVMMRMAAFRDIGGYPNHLVAQDYALFSRMALKYEVDNVSEFLGEYRIHDNNISIRKKDLAAAQLRIILRYQLDKLLPKTDHIDLDILLTPIINSKYTPDEYYTVYREIIHHNRQKKQYPIVELERTFFDNWYAIVMEKAKSNTFPLFLRKPVFNGRYVTAKQIRKTFKQSLKYLLGIRR